MEQILNVINSIGGWPFVVLILGLVAIFLFKKELSELIRKTNKIDKGGINFNTSQDSHSETQDENVKELLDAVGDSITLNELEESITKDLDTRNISNDSDKIKVLIKHLAGTQLLLGFEQIYIDIFGSQIQLLEALNGVKPGGLTRQEIDDGFISTKRRVAPNLDSWDLDKYLRFLHAFKLIVDGKEEEEKEIHITNIGVEFLMFLITTGKNREKLL